MSGLQWAVLILGGLSATKATNFVPGTGCGIDIPFKFLKKIPDNHKKEDLKCAVVKDSKSYKKHYQSTILGNDTVLQGNG